MRTKVTIPRLEARNLVLERRQEISQIDIQKKTKVIIDHLSTMDEYRYADVVHCYINSRSGEVDTRSLIDYMNGWGKSVIVPKLNRTTNSFYRAHFAGWDSIEKNEENYWEPKIGIEETYDDLDLIIVPVLAISLRGRRVGYGRRYYDDFLRKTYGTKIALAFEFQLFDYIESSPDDCKVDKIVTERRVIDARRLANK